MMTVVLEARALPLWHLLGPAVPGLLEASGTALPEVMTARAHDDGFIARTGQDEFLVQAAAAPLDAQPRCWVYARADCVLALHGDGWRQVMAQVCTRDFTGFGAGDWLMLAAAGINVWCRGLPNGLLLGCDPSLGGYFHATLKAVVQDINETLTNHDGVTT